MHKILTAAAVLAVSLGIVNTAFAALTANSLTSNGFNANCFDPNGASAGRRSMTLGPGVNDLRVIAIELPAVPAAAD